MAARVLCRDDPVSVGVDAGQLPIFRNRKGHIVALPVGRQLVFVRGGELGVAALGGGDELGVAALGDGGGELGVAALGGGGAELGVAALGGGGAELGVFSLLAGLTTLAECKRGTGAGGQSLESRGWRLEAAPSGAGPAAYKRA